MQHLLYRVSHAKGVADQRSADIVGFGCGYLGVLMMPLLPRGSTYTGIDRSEPLLAEAEKCTAPDTLIKKGFAPDEAEGFLMNEICILRSVQAGHGTEYILEMACMLISLGESNNDWYRISGIGRIQLSEYRRN